MAPTLCGRFLIGGKMNLTIKQLMVISIIFNVIMYAYSLIANNFDLGFGVVVIGFPYSAMCIWLYRKDKENENYGRNNK